MLRGGVNRFSLLPDGPARRHWLASHQLRAELYGHDVISVKN